MKLPIIRQVNQYITEHSSNEVEVAIRVLEHLSEARGIKEEELDVIGELISNMYGALEVQKLVSNGTAEKDALNQFMQRVMGAIDK